MTTIGADMLGPQTEQSKQLEQSEQLFDACANHHLLVVSRAVDNCRLEIRFASVSHSGPPTKWTSQQASAGTSLEPRLRRLVEEVGGSSLETSSSGYSSIIYRFVIRGLIVLFPTYFPSSLAFSR
jgi:hypothetical protein